jgi:hypothetical protein
MIANLLVHLDYMKKDKEIKTLISKIQKGMTAPEIVRMVLVAVNDKELSLIKNPGVLFVLGEVNTVLKKKAKPNDLISFHLELKKKIAIKGINSHFTELAVNALWQILFDSKKKLNQKIISLFLAKYLYLIIDDFLSQELPHLIGSSSVANVYSFEKLLVEIENYTLLETVKLKNPSLQSVYSLFTTQL